MGHHCAPDETPFFLVHAGSLETDIGRLHPPALSLSLLHTHTHTEESNVCSLLRLRPREGSAHQFEITTQSVKLVKCNCLHTCMSKHNSACALVQ